MQVSALNHNIYEEFILFCYLLRVLYKEATLKNICPFTSVLPNVFPYICRSTWRHHVELSTGFAVFQGTDFYGGLAWTFDEGKISPRLGMRKVFTF